jgi:cellobiose phosphorylase
MVGIQGKGESVWLAWFLYSVLKNFVPVCEYMKDMSNAAAFKNKSKILQKNIEDHTWDGEWYLRAFYDNGDKLGTKDADECMISSISQSWSAISDGGSSARKHQALYSAKRYLVIPSEAASLLFVPPFDKTNNNPGYIKDYYPGTRENGGQYTHAAVWLAIANMLLKDCETAWELLRMLNPIIRTTTKMSALKYEKEPYVEVADISMNNTFYGRGGWSWYTGAAGWLYQAYKKFFLGIQRKKNILTIDPATPCLFGDYSASYCFGGSVYNINVKCSDNPDSVIKSIAVDGESFSGNSITLKDDGNEHQIFAYRE